MYGPVYQQALCDSEERRLLHPVINLKPLNHFIKNQHFKMEGIGKVRELLQKIDWMAQWTWKMLIFQFPLQIAEKHRKFLRVVWNGTTFELNCLPFGLRSAPRVFRKLLKPVMTYLCFRGVWTVIYLDNIFLLAKNRDTLLHQMHCTVQLLEQLGFTINLPKSTLEPTHQRDSSSTSWPWNCAC